MQGKARGLDFRTGAKHFPKLRHQTKTLSFQTPICPELLLFSGMVGDRRRTMQCRLSENPLFTKNNARTHYRKHLFCCSLMCSRNVCSAKSWCWPRLLESLWLLDSIILYIIHIFEIMCILNYVSNFSGTQGVCRRHEAEKSRSNPGFQGLGLACWRVLAAFSEGWLITVRSRLP